MSWKFEESIHSNRFFPKKSPETWNKETTDLGRVTVRSESRRSRGNQTSCPSWNALGVALGLKSRNLQDMKTIAARVGKISELENKETTLLG